MKFLRKEPQNFTYRHFPSVTVINMEMNKIPSTCEEGEGRSKAYFEPYQTSTMKRSL